MNYNDPFALNVPSLFIIQTPFQAMCAINTIRQLEIEDYCISLHLHVKTEKRNKQTIELLEKYSIPYTIFKGDSIGLIKRFWLLFSKTGTYKRVFLGAHLYHDGYYYALQKLQNNANLVHLDDGTATLDLLDGTYKITGRSLLYMAIYKAIASLRRIKLNNLFTVYKEVNSPKWNISYNDLSLFYQSGRDLEKGGVYFIGTNNSVYVTQYHVNQTDIRKKLREVLLNVKSKYPQENIVYIPHGRDNTLFAKEVCGEVGIEYKPLSINVEIYILSLGIMPKAVIGFTSSALYNLKMIFPDMDVVNVVISMLTDKNPSILSASNYYKKQGIPTIKL